MIDDDKAYEARHEELVRLRNERIEGAYEELIAQIRIAILKWITKHEDLFYKP